MCIVFVRAWTPGTRGQIGWRIEKTSVGRSEFKCWVGLSSLKMASLAEGAGVARGACEPAAGATGSARVAEVDNVMSMRPCRRAFTLRRLAEITGTARGAGIGQNRRDF